MANLPSPTKVAGQFLPQYEIYWKRLDPSDSGRVAPLDAAKFLKSSGLNDHTLGKIWDLSDPECRGYLDRPGFFTAVKLVALSQANRELLVECILEDLAAPNFGDQTAPGAKVAAAPRGTPAPSVNFLVKPEEKRKYDALFDQLKPVAGFIPGDKVRNVMLGSKLPMSMLGKIWDLADQDKDGNLDRYEFTVAMHLVYRALQDDMIPDQLPSELCKEKVPLPLSAPISLPELHNGATMRSDDAQSWGSLENNNSTNLANLNTLLDPSPTKPMLPEPLPTLSHQTNLVQTQTQPTDPTGIGSVQAVPWVVNAGDRLRYEALFKQTDNDRDGFVSGVEIKNLFLQTGLPQNILAHIWNLSDMKQEGKLNPEQFALAMYLVQQKQSGKDPPAALTPDMVPPSMRPKGGAATSSGGGNRSVYNNPELEAMAKEIQELLQEKMLLEREVQDTQYNIQARGTESHSLQSEFETLNSTLTQLTNQKNVAQKRLDDLDVQRDSMRTDLTRLNSHVEEENDKISKLRGQADEQEASLKAQEDEVNSKKLELEVLVAEENNLNSGIAITSKEINNLIKTLADIDYLLGETKGKVTELEEAETHMGEATTRFDKVLQSDDPSEAQNVPDLYLEPIRLSLTEPDFSRIEKPARPPPPGATEALQSPLVNGGLTSRDDPFSDMSPETRDPSAFFSNDDAFASFSNNQSASFGAFDPFSSKPSGSNQKPFSAFPNQPFGFGFDGADTPPVPAPRPGDSDSPTPALPPKKQAAPPKRPPPPRRPPPPKAGPAMPEPARPPPPKLSSPDDDPFGEENAFKSNDHTANTNGDSSGFADFGAFDESSFKKGDFSKDVFQDNSSWNEPNTSDSSKGRYTGLDFYEDPFKNSNVRYGDPFDLETSDPFSSGKPDPFSESGSAFGSDPFTNPNSSDPFGAPASASDPFGHGNAFVNKSANGDFFAAKSSESFSSNSNMDPFGSKTLSIDPFGSKPAAAVDPFTSSSDPFGSKNFSQTDSRDPFGSSFSGSTGLGTASVDPFSSNSSNFANDPFSLTTLANLSSPKEPPTSHSNQPSVSSTPSTLSYRKEKHSSSSETPSSSSKKKHGHGLTDFLTGSPLSKSDKKKEKKHGKFHLSSPLKTRSKESPKSEKKGNKENSNANPQDQVMIKMAAEMSKREDSERRRRLQLQEEQELAYAIALSKAEAASLNQQ